MTIEGSKHGASNANGAVSIYSDGACKGNPGAGGWGVLLDFRGQQKELYGGEKNTTNNRMELLAAIKGLQALKRACVVNLYTDSQYVKKGITEWINNWQKNNWKTAAKSPVKNADLWKVLLSETRKHQVQWHWVKGHAGDAGNEAADRLANKGVSDYL